MIKFTDNAFVAGQFFTPGMIAEFDAITEGDLIRDGDAVAYVAQISGTIDHASTADFATSATNAVNAQNAQSAVTAQTAVTAQSANTATTANSANTATTATTATTAATATNASHADTADTASTADHATTATSATMSASADTATTATSAQGVLVDNSSQTAYPILAKPVEALAGFAEAAACATTAVDEILRTFVIKAGTFGPNSTLQIEPIWTFTNSVNNKILKVRVGGVVVYSATRTTSAKEAPLIVLANRNSLASQIAPYGSDGSYSVASASAPATYSIDFSADVIVDITGQRANSGDTLKLEYFRALHFVGD